ncbi:hypothetical protein KJ966_21545 [bacterium]|nr:hypothetical protein [bacterium]
MKTDSIIEFVSKGLCRVAYPPVWGRQDQGVSPGGAIDMFSYELGNIMLGYSSPAPALEIIIPPELKFSCDCWFIILGAAYESVRLETPSKRRSHQIIEHGTVYRAQKGARLKFGGKRYGFRSYLCLRPSSEVQLDLTGRKRGNYSSIATWSEPDNVVRVVEGPEHAFLENPAYFLNDPWRISIDSNDMGMRLTCLRNMPVVFLNNMISGAVSDGTIQLSPGGPIILLRHRQTIGGYPRIFNVISVDIDKLAQFIPGQIIRFKKVSISQAVDLLREKRGELEKFKKRYS